MANQALDTSNKVTPRGETPEAEITRRTDNIRNGHEKLRYSEVAGKGSEGHVVRSVQSDIVSVLEKSRATLSPEAAARLDSYIKGSQRDGKFYADGSYGPQTKELVKLFQEVNNLKVDGIFGKQSLATLDAAKAQQIAAAEPSKPEQVATAPQTNPSTQSANEQAVAIPTPAISNTELYTLPPATQPTHIPGPQDPKVEIPKMMAIKPDTTVVLPWTAEELNPAKFNGETLPYPAEMYDPKKFDQPVATPSSAAATLEGQPYKLSLAPQASIEPQTFNQIVINAIAPELGSNIPALKVAELSPEATKIIETK